MTKQNNKDFRLNQKRGFNKKFKKVSIDISKVCIININSTQNNTILTATNLSGIVITTISQGFFIKKRGKRSVPQGALLSGENIASFLLNKGFLISQIRIKGFGSGRENAIQGILQTGLKVAEIIDITSVPHNGCRPRKSRRL